MVLDFLTPIWKINDIDSCRKIRHLYASTLAYQQRSFILCTAFQIQEWESILYDKDESLTSFLLPLPSLRTPAPRRVPQIADAPSTGSHSSTCTQCWIGAAPWRHSISLPSSGRRTLLFLPKSILVWLSEMKPNVQFMLIWYLFSLFLKFKHLTWKCIRPRRRWTSPSCRTLWVVAAFFECCDMFFCFIIAVQPVTAQRTALSGHSLKCSVKWSLQKNQN